MGIINYQGVFIGPFLGDTSITSFREDDDFSIEVFDESIILPSLPNNIGIAFVRSSDSPEDYATIALNGTNTSTIFIDNTAGSANLAISGDLNVNSGKFTVDSATGDTDVKGDFRVNVDKFTVDSATGDTYIDRDLFVDRNVTADHFFGDGGGISGIGGANIGAAGLNGQIQYNDGSLGGASQLYYDDINHRVGIGTSIPTSKLHVVGDTLITGITTVGLGTTSTPANSQLTFELTSNTTLTIRVKGTDGVTRVGIVTLS